MGKTGLINYRDKTVNIRFYSGCGLTFIGLSNYIAVSSDLEGFVISLNDKTEPYAETYLIN